MHLCKAQTVEKWETIINVRLNNCRKDSMEHFQQQEHNFDKHGTLVIRKISKSKRL